MTTIAPATTMPDPAAPLPELPDLPPPGADRLAWAEALRGVLAAMPGAPVRLDIDDVGDVVVFTVRADRVDVAHDRFYADSTLRGDVVRPGTTEVIGVSTRFPALEGSGGDLAPGESKEFDAFLGTTSCDPALGAVLPPGTYEVVVPVDNSPMGSTIANNLVSEPVTLVVTG